MGPGRHVQPISRSDSGAVRNDTRGSEEPRFGRVTPEQVVRALRRAESGTPVADIGRMMGVTEATYYRWKKQCSGLEDRELRELRQMHDENKKLKQLVAELTPEKAVLREAFNGSVRRECLSQHVLATIAEAQATPIKRRVDYNNHWPHISLGLQPPAEFRRADSC